MPDPTTPEAMSDERLAELRKVSAAWSEPYNPRRIKPVDAGGLLREALAELDRLRAALARGLPATEPAKGTAQ